MFSYLLSRYTHVSLFPGLFHCFTWKSHIMDRYVWVLVWWRMQLTAWSCKCLKNMCRQDRPESLQCYLWHTHTRMQMWQKVSCHITALSAQGVAWSVGVSVCVSVGHVPELCSWVYRDADWRADWLAWVQGPMYYISRGSRLDKYAATRGNKLVILTRGWAVE